MFLFFTAFTLFFLFSFLVFRAFAPSEFFRAFTFLRISFFRQKKISTTQHEWYTTRAYKHENMLPYDELCLITSGVVQKYDNVADAVDDHATFFAEINN